MRRSWSLVGCDEGQEAGIEDNLEDGVRTRLRRELDARLERMLEEICLSGVHSSLAFGALAPDGVPESDKTASARPLLKAFSVPATGWRSSKDLICPPSASAGSTRPGLHC